MKKIVFICAVVLCAGFAGCRKIADDLTKNLPKFECTVNGVEYRSPTTFLLYPPSGLARPIFHENNRDGIFYYSWWTELGPAAENSGAPLFKLGFYLWVDGPLRVGEKYVLDPSEGGDDLPTTGTEEGNVSYFRSWNTLPKSDRMGKGTVEITEYDPESGLIRGVVEAEVPQPASEGGDIWLIKGKFTALLQKK